MTPRYPDSKVFYRHLDRDFRCVASAEGATIIDESGRRYLDASGGVMVANVGHGVEELASVGLCVSLVEQYVLTGGSDDLARCGWAALDEVPGPPEMGETHVRTSLLWQRPSVIRPSPGNLLPRWRAGSGGNLARMCECGGPRDAGVGFTAARGGYSFGFLDVWRCET